MKATATLAYSSKSINRNYRIKVSGIDAQGNRVHKLVGVSGLLLKQEGKEVEKILMKNDPEDGVQGAATLWKLTQAITAHARELSPERSRELHEISGSLLNRVKLNA